MPIYEYYCAVCQGQFRQLARRIDAPVPACPRCGNIDVERMVSAANTLHSSAYHQVDLKQEAGNIDTQNSSEIAQFLKESGRLEDATGVYGSKAYRELIDRRAEGATERELTDLVDDLASEMRATASGKASGAMLFSGEIENRMAAEGPPKDHKDEVDQKKKNSNRDASASANRCVDDLGWV